MYIEIKTERLLLRPLCTDDLNTTYKYASDPAVTRFMCYYPHYNIEETRNFLEAVTNEHKKTEPNFYEFAVILEDKHIGAVSIYLDKKRSEGELAWILDKKYWGNGYATEAALALKNFAANVLHLKKIIATCDYRNRASYNVMKKIGLLLADDNGIRIYPKTQETARELTYLLNLSE